ncbi:hypothetical protein PMAYCL1PPCAC_14778, partial [Pristionchus mayeri]
FAVLSVLLILVPGSLIRAKDMFDINRAYMEVLRAHLPIAVIGGEPVFSRAYEQDTQTLPVGDGKYTAHFMNSVLHDSPRLEGDLRIVTAMENNNELGRRTRLALRRMRRKLKYAYSSPFLR